MSGNDDQPVVELTIAGLTTLAHVQRWVELAESINVPSNTPVDVSGVRKALTVVAWLPQVYPSSEAEPEPCVDALCVLGDHGADWKHFDGKDVW